MIPGLAVDERLFQNLDLLNAEIIPIKWITPILNESLANYATRLSEQIDKTKPFYLIGVSFGGMCCLEITKAFGSIKTILISSAKGQFDLPWYFKILRVIPMHRLLNDNFAKWLALNNKWLFGVKGKEQAALFKDMLAKAPKDYPSRAVNCIVHWRNTVIPKNLIHIHGTKDRIIIFRNVKYPVPIKNGTHFMVMNNAEEISKLVNEELNS